jgi:hypothetical protein
MVMVTNIQHFLDEDGKIPRLPPEAKELFLFLTTVIEVATIHYGQPLALAEIDCRRASEGSDCEGGIEVWILYEDNSIGWECTECGDEGIITDWEGTQWDKRKQIIH